jgi:hypothetical protein
MYYNVYVDDLSKVLLRTKYCQDYQAKEDEMGGACSNHGRDEKYEVPVMKPL